MVPEAPAAMWTVTVKVALAAGFIHPKPQETVPALPKAGVVQVAPGALTDTNVVDAGSTSSTTTLDARAPVVFLTRKV